MSTRIAKARNMIKALLMVALAEYILCQMEEKPLALGGVGSVFSTELFADCLFLDGSCLIGALPIGCTGLTESFFVR
jgi:hypothetical protein